MFRAARDRARSRGRLSWEGGGKLGAEYSIVNYHTGLCLWWKGHMAQAKCSGADDAGDLWYWTGATISQVGRR
jgi:hypothetical protein